MLAERKTADLLSDAEWVQSQLSFEIEILPEHKIYLPLAKKLAERDLIHYFSTLKPKQVPTAKRMKEIILNASPYILRVKRMIVSDQFKAVLNNPSLEINDFHYFKK